MSGRTARTATPDAWVWSAAQGMYYHGASDTYALPSAGGEWTYVAAKDITGRTARGNGSEDREEGEIDDRDDDEYSGWGALMAPEKLARITAAASNGGRDGRDRDVPYAPGHDPYGRDRDGSAAEASTRTTPPAPDPSAHLLRLVVKRSKALPLGGIAVLDAREGGIQLGRDRRAPGDPARVRVREMEVSKVHALVYWGSDGSVDPSGATAQDVHSTSSPEAEGWHIVDLGSTLGTYVAQRGEPDATRLSEPKHASRPYPLHHLARVTLGTTTFVAHIHEDWPCTECQLSGGEAVPVDDGGQAKTTDDTSDSGAAGATAAFDAPVGAAARRGQRQFKRKRAMDALRDTLLGEDGVGAGARRPGEGYIDRSAQRRKLHPPSPPRRSQAEAAHSVTAAPAGPAGPSAASRAMLAKQGWTPGAGLGRAGDGRADAIVPVLRTDRVGLGARGQIADRDPAAGGDPRAGDWRVRGTRRRWDEITKEV